MDALGNEAALIWGAIWVLSMLGGFLTTWTIRLHLSRRRDK